MGIHIATHTIRAGLAKNVQRIARSGPFPQGFARSVLLMATGTGTSQLLLLLCAPLLTRLYYPADFATYSLAMVGASLGTVLATGRYEFAIALPRSRTAARRLTSHTFILAAAVSGALAGGVLLVDRCTHWTAQQGEWLWLVPPSAAVLAWWSIAVKWQAREQRFRQIGLASIVAVAGTLLIQLGTPAWHVPNGATLIVGQMVGRLLGVAVLAIALLPELGRSLTLRGLRRGRRQLRRYWRFPAFTASASLIGRASGEAPKILLALLFHVHVLGLYAFSLRVLQIPMTLVGQSVSEVFYPRISQLRHDTTAQSRLFGRTVLALAAVVTPPMALLFFFSADIFEFAFGSHWRAAGEVSRLLIPVLWAEFVVAPVLPILQSTGKQHILFCWQMTLLALTLAVFWLLAGSGSRTALMAYAIIASAMYLLLLVICWSSATGRSLSVLATSPGGSREAPVPLGSETSNAAH